MDRRDRDRCWDRRLALFRSAELRSLGIGNGRLGHHCLAWGPCDPVLAWWSINIECDVATFMSAIFHRDRFEPAASPGMVRHAAESRSKLSCRYATGTNMTETVRRLPSPCVQQSGDKAHDPSRICLRHPQEGLLE